MALDSWVGQRVKIRERYGSRRAGAEGDVVSLSHSGDWSGAMLRQAKLSKGDADEIKRRPSLLCVVFDGDLTATRLTPNMVEVIEKKED